VEIAQEEGLVSKRRTLYEDAQFFFVGRGCVTVIGVFSLPYTVCFIM